MRSVANALRVIEQIRADEPLGVSEIARQLDLAKATVQRILQTLHAQGWIAPTRTTPTRWQASTKMFALGARLSKGWDLRSAALSSMQDLSEATGESVNLGILQSRYIVQIERVSGPSPIGINTLVGVIVPAYATAAGKAMLAHMSDDEVRGIVGDMGEQLTRNTITRFDALRADIELIRRRGYSVSHQESRAETIAIGAAVLDGLGRPVAAISVAGPVMRLDERRIEAIAPLVVEAAAAITLRCQAAS